MSNGLPNMTVTIVLGNIILMKRIDVINSAEFDAIWQKGFKYIRKTLTAGCHLQRALDFRCNF